jgi:lipopolysaccharide biosynthesis regulator YciM
MRFINVIFFVLIGFALVSVGYVYVENYVVLSQQVVLFQDNRIRVTSLILAVFLLGFVLNLLYTGFIEFRRMLKNLNASAATRAGKRFSAQLQEARELIAHGLLNQARQSLEALVKERSNHVAASLMLGEVLLKVGEPGLAVKYLESLALAEQDLVEPQYLLADAYVASRNPEGAIALLKRLAGDYPKQALKALRRLRALFVEASRWEEALDIHRRLSSRFLAELNQTERAQGVALTFQMGLMKVEADQFKDAAQTFQQVIKDDPSFVPAYLGLGRCMILQDQEAQGIEIWLEGFRTSGEGAMLQEIEDYFIQCGRPEEGLSVLQRVAATSEHQTTAKFFLGKMYYRLEILDEALELFKDVRAQVVYSPILFFFMAKIHARRGRMEQALNEYRQLLRNLGILKLRYECNVCGHRAADYQDRCESCGSWNSVHFLFKENELSEVHLRPESGSWLAIM